MCGLDVVLPCEYTERIVRGSGIRKLLGDNIKNYFINKNEKPNIELTNSKGITRVKS